MSDDVYLTVGRAVDLGPPTGPISRLFPGEALTPSLRNAFAAAALPAVIAIAEATMPADADPKQAAELIAARVFDIANAMVREALARPFTAEP